MWFSGFFSLLFKRKEIEVIDWPVVIKAVIWQESNGNPDAVSESGAQGLMQLMPRTGRQLADEFELHYQPFDPIQNEKLGTIYLKRLYHQFKDLKLALTAYHSGPGRVARLLKQTKGKTLDDIIDQLGPVGKRYAHEVLDKVKKLRERKV